MPELPEIQALAERMDAQLAGTVVDGISPLGFAGLKTTLPAPDEVVGATVADVGRRGKYLVVGLDDGRRIALHLSQAGRVDFEVPPKTTRPRGAVVRLVFRHGTPGGAGDGPAIGVLVREHGTQRKAGWWVLAPDDDGPFAALGPDPFDEAFAELVATTDDNRHVHTWLRDQRTVAGIGRGWADDICNRAGLSPFASVRSLDDDARQRLLDAVRAVLEGALALERTRTGGLSDAKLGGRFLVHNGAGKPCPRCTTPMHRVSFESYEITYCVTCQTAGKVLADRRLSRLLR